MTASGGIAKPPLSKAEPFCFGDSSHHMMLDIAQSFLYMLTGMFAGMH